MNAEHADLEARFAAPAERDLPPGRHQLHREILMNHMLSQPPTHRAATPGRRRPGRTRGRLLAAAAGATAIAAAVTGYVITAGHAPGAKPPATAASHAATGHARTGSVQQATLAAKILHAAAAHLASTPVAEPSPGQWIYYKTLGYSYSASAQPAAVTTDQEWITFDGSGSAYYQGGQLVTHTSTANLPGPTANPWAAWNADATPKTAYDVIASLPGNPQAILAVIARQVAGQGANDLAGNPIAGIAPTTQAQREFDYLTQILWNATIGVGGPPAAEAAAYRALATLPGISVQPGITDTGGGQSIGVSDDGGYDQLLIDPVSYQVIGIRQLSTGIDPLIGGNSTLAIVAGLRSGHLSASLRKTLDAMPAAIRAHVIAEAKEKQTAPAYPAKGTLMQEIVYVQNTEVAAPGDR